MAKALAEAVALAMRDADERHRMLRAAARVAQAAIDKAKREGAILIDVIHILQDQCERDSQLPDTDEQPEQHEPDGELMTEGVVLGLHEYAPRLAETRETRHETIERLVEDGALAVKDAARVLASPGIVSGATISREIEIKRRLPEGSVPFLEPRDPEGEA